MPLMTFLIYDLPNRMRFGRHGNVTACPHAWCFMGQLMDPGLQSRKGDVHRNIAGWVSEGGL